MKRIVIIPTNMGGQRFPGNPLAVIKGTTLLRRCYEHVLGIQPEDVYIATPDPAVKSEIMWRWARFPENHIITTSNNCTNGIKRVSEAANIIGVEDEEIYMIAQFRKRRSPSIL